MGNSVQSIPAQTNLPPQRRRIAAGPGSASVAWYNPGRTGLTIRNFSGGGLLVNEGFEASPADHTDYVYPGGIWESPQPVFDGPVSVYWESPGANDYVRVTERGVSAMASYAPGTMQSVRSINLAGIAIYQFTEAQGLDLVTYQSFMCVLEGVRPSVDGKELYVRVNGASGATDYEYAGRYEFSNATTAVHVSTGAPQIAVSPGAIGNGGGLEFGLSGIVTLVSGGGTTTEPLIIWDVAQRELAGVMVQSRGKGVRKSGARITSLDFRTNDATTFDQGMIYIYGIRRP